MAKIPHLGPKIAQIYEILSFNRLQNSPTYSSQVRSEMM